MTLVGLIVLVLRLFFAPQYESVISKHVHAVAYYKFVKTETCIVTLRTCTQKTGEILRVM